jgi:alpha-beta hydrolase superfamily lysophospholipase
MRVSEWLQDTYPQVRRTGLIGFCWGGNLGLLAAWFDGRASDDPSITPILSSHLDPARPRRHYTAGIMAFSPMLRWEEMMDETETPQDACRKPIVNYFQKMNRERMEMKHHPSVCGKLRVLIDYEFCRSELTSEFPMEDAYLSLRLVPYKDRPCPPKMESARVPVLMVHAANDMFASPQAIADLMTVTRNPNVAALILRGGGHVGFFPYNRAFTYSLILNFFNR